MSFKHQEAQGKRPPVKTPSKKKININTPKKKSKKK